LKLNAETRTSFSYECKRKCEMTKSTWTFILKSCSTTAASKSLGEWSEGHKHGEKKLGFNNSEVYIVVTLGPFIFLRVTPIGTFFFPSFFFYHFHPPT
jgi:hypothetical protein